MGTATPYNEALMLDELTHRLWLSNAKKGMPPPIEEVAQLQYDLDVPHFWRDHFFEVLRTPLDRGGRKRRYCREVARDNGKTTLVYLLILYFCEYIIPFLPGLRSQNRRALLIGRDKPHVNDSLMHGLHQMLAEYSPWLKDLDWEEACEKGQTTPLEMGIRRRIWNRDLFTLSNGVSIRGLSVRQSPRGEHVPLAAVDDLLFEGNWMFSEKYFKWLNSALMKGILPGGTVLLTGTPQNDDDVYDLVRKDKRWDYVQLPGHDYNNTYGYRAANKKEVQAGNIPESIFKHPEDWNCLWPGRLNWDGHQDEMGETRESILSYEREVLLKRIVDTDSFIPSEHVLVSLDPNLHYIHAAAPKEGPYYGGIDPSSLSKDDAAVAIGLVEPDGTLIPRHFSMVRAKDHKNTKGEGDPANDPERKVVNALIAASQAFNYPVIKVEKNGFQGSIRPFSDLIDPHVASTLSKEHLGVNKHTESGWLALRTIFRSRRIRLPYGPTPTEKAQIDAGLLDESQIEARVITNELRSQIANLRIVEGRIINASSHIHDDMVSALFLLAKAARNAITSNISASAAPLPSGASLLAAANSQSGRNPELDGPQRDVTMNRLQRAQRMAAGRRQY